MRKAIGIILAAIIIYLAFSLGRTCSTLRRSKFQSPEEKTGTARLPMSDTEPGLYYTYHSTISFEDGQFMQQESDYVFVGPYTCVFGTVVAHPFFGGTIFGAYNPFSGTLLWNGEWYQQNDPTQIAPPADLTKIPSLIRIEVDSTNAWHLYDLLAPLVERVVVANPIRVKQIAQARVTPALAGGARETDIRDTVILARLLAANLVPDVWVPPAHVREMRQLLSQRRQFVETHTQIVNRMHSVAHRHHLSHPAGKRFNEKTTGWQKDKRLSKIEQFQVQLEMENLAYIEKQIERVSKEVRRMCHQKPWAESMTYLMQLPGFGVITAMTILAAIGDVQRFESPKHLASYSGLTPGLEQSGTKNRGKGITKEGRRELRWALVEAAQRAVKSDPIWKTRFQEMQKRMHRNQAIAAIAHRLLELVWHVLTRRQPYRHFSHERIAYKYLTWAWKMDEEARDGLTRQQFARYSLMRLGIGHDLTRIALDPKHPRRIASEAELLALRPELKQTE